MEIFNSLDNIETKFSNVSLALGFFDGVHIGHKAVIQSAVKYSQMNNCPSVVVTFKKHPIELFTGRPQKYINTNEQRASLIRNLGVDYLFEYDFDESISDMSGEDYLKNIIIQKFSPKFISTGFNHTFGKNKSGDAELLESLQSKYGFTYLKIPSQKINNKTVSSSLIRKLISNGKIEEANEMLGYIFSISGEVIHGNHLGSKIGYPTANIKYPNSIIEIPYGVYSTIIYKNKAVTNYGEKPTIGSYDAVVEAHILNFNKNIYNNNIKIEFIKKIRDEHKFDSVDNLIVQIKKDIAEC